MSLGQILESKNSSRTKMVKINVFLESRRKLVKDRLCDYSITCSTRDDTEISEQGKSANFNKNSTSEFEPGAKRGNLAQKKCDQNNTS